MSHHTSYSESESDTMQNSTQKPMCKNKNRLSIELVNRPFINYWIYANSLVTCQCTLCCMLCVAFKLFSMGSMAWNMREEDIFQHISNTSMDTLEASIWYQFRRSGLKVYNGNAVSDHGSYRVEMFPTRAEPDMGISILPHHLPVVGSTGSDACLEKAKSWLENCLANHDGNCAASPQSQRSLPRRILDVSQHSADTIRLLEDVTEIEPYVCLSHCWGSPENHPLKTTLGNISHRKLGIRLDELPRTFLEVVTFVRRLGYRYLWIDSLCIVQDDTEDWRIEAAKMADIYEGSILTIAAAAAPDSTHGLFSPTSPSFQGISLSKITGDERFKNIWIRRALDHSKELLDSRGWIMQERILSPRLLYFGKEEMAWECLQEIACECNHTEPNDKPSSTREIKAQVHPRSIAPGRASQISSWAQLTEQYCSMQLSYEADIFPALSGVAKRLRPDVHSQYIAGLWKDFIFHHLIWKTETDEPKSDPLEARRPDRWRAPSFSWASIIYPSQKAWMGYYSMEGNKGRCPLNVRLVDANCELAGPDDTAQISSGYIDLKGSLVRCRIWKSKAGNWRIKQIQEFRGRQFFPDYEYNVRGLAGVKNGEEVFCFCVCEEVMDPELWRRQFLVLRRIRGTETGGTISGISNQSVGVYERIGLLHEYGDWPDIREDQDRRSIPSHPGEDVTVRII